jgi:HYR domain
MSMETVQLDNEYPVITGCTNITVANDPSLCGAAVTYNIGFSDNCGILNTFISTPSGNIFPVGTTQVKIEVKDVNGNFTSCSFDVTVLDTEAPVPNCPANITAVGTNLNGNCSGVVTFAVTASDNCSASVTTVPASGSIFPSGITTVVATAIDPSGNIATCSFDVNVLCSYPPIYEVENDTITCIEACTCCGNTPKVCIPLVATSAVPNGIIGMDFCMSYDQNLVHPTGNATLGQVVLTSTNNPATDAAFSINTQFTNPGELHVSIYYTGGIYNFTGAGDIICVEFELLPTFTAGQTTCFGICELIESYQSNILFSSATTGCLTFENDSVMEVE